MTEWTPLLWALRRIGLIRVQANGKIRWPISVSPFWMWKSLWRTEPLVGFFRNLPGVVKWERGRLLPRRWGIRIWFVEIGDRG